MQSPDQQRLFDTIDTDRSGTIEDSELLVHLISQGVEEKVITALFRALDVNSDGSISRDEWRDGFELYTKALEAREKREVKETAAQTKRAAEAQAIAARDDFRELTVGYDRMVPVLDRYAVGYPGTKPESVSMAGGGCKIKLAEHRAITLPQLRAVKAQIGRRCPAEGWTTWKGEPLTPATVALYDVNTFVILPGTVTLQCSFVELLATGPQLPKWFVSHWWGESVRTRARGGWDRSARRGSHGAARLARR